MATELNERKQAIYDFICLYVDKNGYPPTVREIAQKVGLASTSSVANHLRSLEQLGYIIRDPKKPRAMLLPFHESQQSESSRYSLKDDVTYLPLIGQVAAGLPILAEENIEETIPVPNAVAGNKGDFILRVRGESMINAGIFNNDLVIVKQQNNAYNGEIVVALLDDSATVKTFYKESDRIRLQPENDHMDPIYCMNPRILGKVVGLLRYF